MKSIAALVAELVAAPRPVLCLDTCIFLDVITTGNRSLTDLIEVNRRLSDILVTTPDRIQLVVTSLVLREWIQRKDEVRDEATKWLASTDRQILEIHRAWERLGRPLATPRPAYHDPDLVNRLTSLAESLLRGSAVLQEDMTCIMRALQRVKRKMRPSHNKQIKDSIHLETYMELSRRLRDAAYGQPVVFASTNSSDFWEDKNTPERPHTELADDLSAADLIFFGRLPLALRHLGLLGAATAPTPPPASPPGGP
jgi:hypothetical protein